MPFAAVGDIMNVRFGAEKDRNNRRKGDAAVDKLLPLQEETRLKDLMAAYPWLKEEAVKLDRRFQMLDSPLGKMLLKKATIADASRYTGFGTGEIIAEITKMITTHGA